jgi:hypothetical protein
MNETLPPTVEDWAEESLVSVLRELDDSWRHGNRVYEVFHRESDSTYWSANYQESGDGEYNSLREGEEDFTQVFPHTKVVTETHYSETP